MENSLDSYRELQMFTDGNIATRFTGIVVQVDPGHFEVTVVVRIE